MADVPPSSAQKVSIASATSTAMAPTPSTKEPSGISQDGMEASEFRDRVPAPPNDVKRVVENTV